VNAHTLEDDEFAVDCNYAPPEEGRNGPPDGWTKPSWFNRETLEWWWLGKLDAPKWKPHRFVRAPAGSGKSTLLEFVRARLDGAAVGAVARQLIRRLGSALPTAFVVLESTGARVEGDR